MFSISLNFTAEHAENAKASESSAWIETVFLIKNSPINQSIQQRKEEKRGARLVKQFCDKARSDPQFKFILDQVPLLQAFMRQYPEEVSYIRQLTHGNIISLIDKDNEEREIIRACRYGNQLICQVDNGDEYEYCLGQVLGTTGDYPCTIKMYK